MEWQVTGGLCLWLRCRFVNGTFSPAVEVSVEMVLGLGLGVAFRS